MGKLVTSQINETYKLYLGWLMEDMGTSIVIKVKSGHNPSIPWDDENDEPLNSADWPDEEDWYVYTDYTVENVIVMYPSTNAIVMSAGLFDAQDVKVVCKLESVLVDAASPQGQTYFDLDDLDYITIEGYNYVRKGTTMKKGLLADDRYVCEVILTRKME